MYFSKVRIPDRILYFCVLSKSKEAVELTYDILKMATVVLFFFTEGRIYTSLWIWTTS